MRQSFGVVAKTVSEGYCHHFDLAIQTLEGKTHTDLVYLDKEVQQEFSYFI